MSITAEKMKGTRSPRAIPFKLPKESERSMYSLALQRTAALRKLTYQSMNHLLANAYLLGMVELIENFDVGERKP